MTNALINFAENHIAGKSFFAEWVTTGRALTSNECLDENAAYIEDAASIANILSFMSENLGKLKKGYFENNKDVSLVSFADFVISEYGYSAAKNSPCPDGGNVTYSLYVK